MRIITDTPGTNTIGYPTCRSWSGDGRTLFIESSRPRPDGTHIAGERQLLQVDAGDGSVTHLATLEVEDIERYGPAHLAVSSQYHADYSPLAGTLVYYDMIGHNLYALSLDTGKRARILHEPEGTIGDPPSISADGTRVVYYVFYPAIENRYLTGRTTVIFALDLDPVTLEVTGGPNIVEAFPGRKGPKYAENERDQVHVNHCQINPTDKDDITYAHEFHGVGIDGSILKTRIWHVRADGSGNRPLVRQYPGDAHTHEVFGPKGTSIYFPSAGNVYAVDIASGEKRLVAEWPEMYPNHITVSPDERWIAADTCANLGKDAHGNLISALLLMDILTGEKRVLLEAPRLPKHPGHMHPAFSPDGARIAFTIADGPDTQVAWTPMP